MTTAEALLNQVRPEPRETNFELNLAPIIDCLVVLIAFMLAAVSLAAVSIIDAGFSPEAINQTNATAGSPQLTISVHLKSGKALRIVTAGTSGAQTTTDDRQSVELAPLAQPGQPASWDLDRLQAEMSRIAQLTQDGTRGSASVVSIVAEDSVAYEDVIRVMDQVRKVIPNVVLAEI